MANCRGWLVCREDVSLVLGGLVTLLYAMTPDGPEWHCACMDFSCVAQNSRHFEMLFSRCLKYLAWLSPSLPDSGYQPCKSYEKLLVSVFCVAVQKSVFVGIYLSWRDTAGTSCTGKSCRCCLIGAKKCVCPLLDTFGSCTEKANSTSPAQSLKAASESAGSARLMGEILHYI